MTTLKYKLLRGGIEPLHATPGAACWDLAIPKTTVITSYQVVSLVTLECQAPKFSSAVRCIGALYIDQRMEKRPIWGVQR